MFEKERRLEYPSCSGSPASFGKAVKSGGTWSAPLCKADRQQSRGPTELADSQTMRRRKYRQALDGETIMGRFIAEDVKFASLSSGLKPTAQIWVARGSWAFG